MIKEDHSLSESLLHNYQSTHLLGYEITHNRIVFLTNNHLTLVNMESSGPSGLTDILKLNGKNVLRFATDKKSLIAILYGSGILEVRRLDQIQEVQYKFTNIECRKNESNSQAIFNNRGCNNNPSGNATASDYPKIYWDNNEIYLLYEEKMEIINMAMKERKAYNDIITSNDGQKIKGMALSKLIDNQRIVIIQFNNKLTFNIVPIPITFMQIGNVTQIGSVSKISSPKDKKQNNQNNFLLREYLILVLERKILQIYNIISMKLIMEINYEPAPEKKKKGEKPAFFIQFKTDARNQYLVVTLHSGKLVQRSILYKINVDYYYTPCKEYFKEEEPFLLWEIDIPVCFPVVLLPAHTISLNQQKYESLEMCYFRHDPVYGEGEINHCSMMVKGSFRTAIKNSKRKLAQWVQLREWKDIITSYIEMKNTLDQIDMGFDDDEPDADTSVTAYGSCLQNFSEENYNKKKPERTKEENAIQVEVEESTKQVEESEKEYEKYEHIKACLEDAAKKFQSEKMNDIIEVGEYEDEEKEKKLEEEFIKFMQAYLKEKNLDVNPNDLFLEFEREDTPPKNKTQQKEKTRIENSVKSPSNSSIARSKSDMLPTAAKTQQLQQQHQTSKKTSKRPQKNFSSSSLLNISKSGGETDHSKEIKEKEDTDQDAKEEISSEDFDSDQEHVNQLYLGIEKAINKGFEPLEKKLDQLSDHMHRYEDIHIAQLNRCANLVEREKNYLTNIDSMISGYCNEFMLQFNSTLDKGLKSYWQRIEEIDRRSMKERDKTVNQFGKFIDQQIKNRESVFDTSRMSLENHLSHIRKKIHLGQDPRIIEEDFQEEEILESQVKREPKSLQEQFDSDCLTWFKKFNEKQNSLFKP